MDDQNVPRRLRRFLRRGEPIPENLLPKTVPDNEPWNQPAVTAQAKSNIAMSARKASAEEAIAPRHRGKRFQEMQRDSFSPSPPTRMDKAIGLEKKAQFQEHLPSAGNKAIEMKKTEIQKALDDIKRFRESTSSTQSSESIDQMAEHIAEQNKSAQKAEEEKSLSFHFTPIGSVPSPVDAKKLVSSAEEKPPATNPIPIPDLSKLSARERMEFRRQQRGQNVPATNQPTPASNPSATRAAPVAPTAPISTEPRSHIRRRMGQVDSSESAESRPTSMNEEENMTPEAEEDFKDLFSDDTKSPQKKKAKKPTSEDEELDTEEDMELFEEEK